MATDDRDEYEDDLPTRRGLTTEQARARVRGPAVGLIVVGVVSLAMIALGVIQYPGLPAQFEAQNAQIEANPELKPEQKQQMKEVMRVYQDVAVKVLPVMWAVVGVTSLVTIAGGLKVMSLSGRGLGITAAILAMLPCVSGCCVLGLPVGIWALVVLFNPEVKAAFAANRYAGAGPTNDLDPGFDRDDSGR